MMQTNPCWWGAWLYIGEIYTDSNTSVSVLALALLVGTYLGRVVDIADIVAVQKGIPKHTEKHTTYQIARVVYFPLQK